MNKVEIKREIDYKEILVRSAKHPYHVKNNSPHDGAFMPKAGSNEVSILRYIYTNADFCKSHSFKIIKLNSGESFAGLIIFNKNQLLEVSNAKGDVVANDKTKPIIDVKGTPIDEDGNYIEEEIKVYVDDPGLPMHADIIYNVEPPALGVPSNPIRRIAKALAKKSKLKIDNSPNPEKWLGEEIKLD